VENNACMQILLSVTPPLERVLKFFIQRSYLCLCVGVPFNWRCTCLVWCLKLKLYLALDASHYCHAWSECHFPDLIGSINGGLELQVSGPGGLGYGRTVTYSHGCCRLLTRLYNTFQKLRILQGFRFMKL